MVTDTIYQDAHGTFSEADLMIAARHAFQEYDKADVAEERGGSQMMVELS